MEREETNREFDRRTALALGLTGISALVLGATSAAVAEEVKEIAPGVKMKILREVPGEIPGYGKVRWREITWSPGAKLGPITMKNVMICEIAGGPLEQHVEGQAPITLKPGDTYFCHIGTVETDENKGTVPSTMRVIDLMPA